MACPPSFRLWYTCLSWSNIIPAFSISSPIGGEPGGEGSRDRQWWVSSIIIEKSHKGDQLSGNNWSPQRGKLLNMWGKSSPGCVQTPPAVPSISCPHFRQEGHGSNASQDSMQVSFLSLFLKSKYKKNAATASPPFFCCPLFSTSVIDRSVSASLSLFLLCSSSRWVTTMMWRFPRGGSKEWVDKKNQRPQAK